MKVEERTKLIVITILLSVATSVTFYFHIVLQEGTIFTQFFYLPLTLAAIWYRRYALLLVAYLAALLYVTDLYIGSMGMLANDILRTTFFLMVVIVISYLSERLRRTQEVLERSNALLEAEVDRRTGELKSANAELLRELEKRRRAENQLAEEMERLSVTLSSIGDGVIVTDTMGRALTMNDNAERLTGKTIEAAKGLDVGEAFPSVDASGNLQSPTAQSLADGGIHPLEGLYLLRPDGTRIALSGTVAPIRASDMTIGAVAVIRDDSEKDKVRQQIARANRVRAIELMAGGVAHDLNNILTVMSSNVELVKLRMHDDPDARTRLNEAEKATERARELVRQMMSLSKADKPDRKLISLKPVLREEVEFSLRDSPVRADMDITDDLWDVMADQVQVRGVISNLVINARQEMVAGGELKVRAVNVTIAPGDGVPLPAGRYVRISVQDHGRGIAPQDLDRIFEPYYTTKRTGCGLGLPISQSIVLGHRGHLGLESEVGKGTTFTIHLPAADGQASPPS
ncbi:MAG: PAS domain S-box protein [Methanomassiliicoccus sp.]|nr:PAS domain S-box protein [Methanomassiliicoccus sp.]